MARHIPSEQVCKELESIKKAKEDQELWDKVAFTAWSKGLSNVTAREDHEIMLDASMEFADAFMAERAKRMGEA